jgi:hypothetical protein
MRSTAWRRTDVETVDLYPSMGNVVGRGSGQPYDEFGASTLSP